MDFLKNLWMDFLYPLVCVYGPCILYQAVASKTTARERRIPVRHFIWTYVFILYLFMVFQAVGMGSIWEIGAYGSAARSDEINLIPFHSDGCMTYILNVIMFMPLGFLLPLIWERYRSFVRVLTAGAAFSLAIELGQLFNRRVTDIDDLIMNTLGAVIGFGIWIVFRQMFQRKKRRDNSITGREADAYIILSVLGTFLLYNWRYFVKIFYD